MAKFYAIYKGKSGVPKILDNWEECKKEVIGCKGAIYKSFTTKKEALEFIECNKKGKTVVKKSVKEHESNKNEEELLNSGLVIYVDGSFSLEKGNYSYGLVALNNGEEVYKDYGVGEDKDSISLRNVAGEVLGSLTAVEYAIKNNYEEVTIVYDYQGIESWALGTWKRNKDLTIDYHNRMKINMKKINIKFLKVKGHSGDKYNDIADSLAKRALGIIS